nr:hypothetical protein [Tanacetum cinerariifolium]
CGILLPVGIEDSDGLGYGEDRGSNFWNIDRDIFELNLLHEVHTSAERFEFLHQNGMIGIDVASTDRNNDIWFGVLRIIQEIKFEKDLVLEDFESFIGSIVEEDSSGVENSLCWIV